MLPLTFRLATCYESLSRKAVQHWIDRHGNKAGNLRFQSLEQGVTVERFVVRAQLSEQGSSKVRLVHIGIFFRRSLAGALLFETVGSDDRPGGGGLGGLVVFDEGPQGG